MAKGHRLFYRNGRTLNGHGKMIGAVVPVVKELLRYGVQKINTAPSFHAHGRRLIKITRTGTGLAIEARGEGGRQVVYACTGEPDAVAERLKKKFRQLVVD